MILVTGAAGMVGSYCTWEDAVRTDIQELDVRYWDAVRGWVGDHRPEWVVHLAAETDVDECERRPDHAMRTNAVGTRNVALACLEFGCRLVYMSTAGVFDGEQAEPYDEFHSPCPPNVYGRSKLAGEGYVRTHVPRGIVVRTGWMMGGGPGRDKKFVGKIIAQLTDPGVMSVRAVDDKLGSPTYAADLVKAVRRLMERERFGTVHVAGEGVATRFDVACYLRDVLAPRKSVERARSAEFPLAAPRGRSECITSLVRAVDGVEMRFWKDALGDYLASEWSP